MRSRWLGAALVAAAAAPGPVRGGEPPPDVQLFFQAAAADRRQSEAALETIAGGWRDGYTGLVLDLARFFPSSRPRPRSLAGDVLPPPGGDKDAPPAFGRFPSPPGAEAGLAAGADRPAASGPHPRGGEVRARLVRFLERRTGRRFGDDLARWRRWLWNRPYEPHPDYAVFKAALYGQIDPRMGSFFPPGAGERVRLDEVDWGGVKVNGIPPLDHPAVESASGARWLKDDHVVFGLAIGGEARAYPKRILAWHELARDRLGGVELAIVYCTLCGTVIPFEAEVGGRHFTFGTSGLLYRSNKLLFDEETMSLWSTTEGRPVLGTLAGSDLELRPRAVVTTTWGEWRALHPETTVLSLATGHERDYAEGAAYRDYFATDRLMFQVPRTDPRLRNKDEVLALLLRPRGEGADTARRALALSVRFLQKNPLHAFGFAGHDLLIVTSPGGANRVYETAGRRFARGAAELRLRDDDGRSWRVAEDALVPEDGGDLRPLPRVPARRAFWFGWYAQFPDTELVK